jgi:uncharacterized repeat protein (TIGR03803 family)
MNNRVLWLVALLALPAEFASQADAAVSFSITPSAISNTYGGTITLQVNGLSNGDTVVVQRFLDANTNGVVDAGDLLWQQFQLTDGVNSVFHDGVTSVTNFDVPGDVDGLVNGSVRATLYPDFDFTETIVAGKYLFVLSSPSGHFTPQTNSLSVTNFPFPQSFTGTVVNNSFPVPNAMVLLFQFTGGSRHIQGGTVANNAGAYTINVPAGGYQLVACKSNFVANIDASPSVTIGAGATIPTNVPLSNATQSLSGKIVDADNTSIGLSGYLVAAQTAGNLLAVTYSDTNGNFLLPTVADQWSIHPSESSVYKGYVKTQNGVHVDTSGGSVSGVTVALPKATAIFYGSVKDNNGKPLAGTYIISSDANDEYESEGLTDTNGNYIADALGGSGVTWRVQIDSDYSSPTNYIFSQGSDNIDLADGQAYRHDFTALLVTNQLFGHVYDSFTNPISGLGVNANATIGGIDYQNHTETDANGYYSLNVGSGNWTVSVNCGDGGDGLQDIFTNISFQCPDNQVVVISNNNHTSDFIVQLPGIGQIFGTLIDNYGNPIGGVNIYASDNFGDNYSRLTDGTGRYQMMVVNGTFDVSADCGQLGALNYSCPADDSITVSDDSRQADFVARRPSTPSFPFATVYGFSSLASNLSGIYTNRVGDYPSGGLLLMNNLLYGTTQEGGTNGSGTVFMINTNITGSAAAYTFTPLLGAVGTNSDGASPNEGLILSGGMLYGTTPIGGTNGAGTVFAVNTNGSGFKVLYTFSAPDPVVETNNDGASPNGGLILSGNTLYGTTYAGGTNGTGTVFAVNTNGSGFKVLYTFSAPDPVAETNNDGAGPNGGLILAGNTLYGTTYYGGAGDSGTLFRVGTNGTSFTALYNFTSADDGAYPYAGLVLASNVLYGTAYESGYYQYGTIFSIETNGANFSVLHAFTGADDGRYPSAGLSISGNTLYGSTESGGIGNNGVVFAINVAGSNFVALHEFTNGNDGADPIGDLLLAGNTLYGTTTSGGTDGNGTVFAVSILPSAAPQLLIIRDNANVILTWPSSVVGFRLEAATNLLSPASWITNLPAPVVINGRFTVTNSISGKQMFYRLSE